MKNNFLLDAFLYAIGLTFVMWFLITLSSCGIRKSSVNIEEKKIKTRESELIENNLVSNAKLNVKKTESIDSSNFSIIEKNVYTPIDATKLAVFTDEKGNEHSLSNASYTNEKTTSKTDKKTNKTSDESKDTSTKDLSTSKKDKTTDVSEHNKIKDTFNFPLWWLWFLLAIPIVYFIYKNKSKLVV